MSQSMLQVIAVALGGAFGALARYNLSLKWGALHSVFPWPTLSINIIGSLLMGVTWVALLEKSRLSETYRFLLMTGMLGGFTTFSTFSLEAFLLIEKGHLILAFAYILLSIVLCIVALMLGVWITRLVL